jgi:hypothetical protein
MAGAGEWQALEKEKGLENLVLQSPSLTLLWPLPFKRTNLGVLY